MGEPLFIFDYDCCILPTFEIQRLGVPLDTTNIDNTIQNHLHALGDLVVATLGRALSYGKVCIVTNAEAGWVLLTVRAFFPRHLPFFEALDVYSARTLFEPQGYLSPLQWKLKAFELVVSLHGNSRNFQVISIGDSLHEREAVISVCLSRGLVYKSVKMLDRPDLHCLARQHLLIQKRLPDIVAATEALDVRVHLA